jgi:hypothetical protein
VQQAAISNCLSFDRFPFYQDGLAPPKIDFGGRQVADALVISQMIIIGDEGLDLGFEITWQVLGCSCLGRPIRDHAFFEQ